MPTQAIASYGTQLRLSDGVPLAAWTVVDASNTAPIVLTLNASHGLPTGEVTWADVTGIGGNLAANGAHIVEATTASQLKLRGSVGSGVYTGGGSVVRRGTFTHIAELVNLTPVGISFNMVDASAHDGAGWGTSIPTQKRGVDMRVEINLVPNHPTHDEVTGLIGLALNKVRRDWLVVLPDAGKTAIAFQAWVSDHGTQTPVDGVLRSNPMLSIDGAMQWGVA